MPCQRILQQHEAIAEHLSAPDPPSRLLSLTCFLHLQIPSLWEVSMDFTKSFDAITSDLPLAYFVPQRDLERFIVHEGLR